VAAHLGREEEGGASISVLRTRRSGGRRNSDAALGKEDSRKGRSGGWLGIVTHEVRVQTADGTGRERVA
jgi:hypothetical protein